MYESAPEPEAVAVAVAELGFDALSDAMVFKIPPQSYKFKDSRRERERERERESRV